MGHLVHNLAPAFTVHVHGDGLEKLATSGKFLVLMPQERRESKGQACVKMEDIV